MSKRPPVAEHLSEDEYNLFLIVYKDHMQRIGTEKRKKYSVSNLVKIERNIKEKCLEVHFKNGDWFHYATNGTYY